MRWRCALLLSVLFGAASFGFVSSARAGAITGSCDDRSANKGECAAWVQENLEVLGCFPRGMRCVWHPWGSDFTKSWNCTTQSTNCEVATGPSCPTGTVRLFRDGWVVCRKGAPSAFRGECVHKNANHFVVASSCDEAKKNCLPLGGVPARSCEKQGGDWAAECDFREMRLLLRHGSSCEELRDRCERSNSPKGPNGTLTRCLAD